MTNRSIRGLALLVALLLAPACADLATTPERVPTTLLLDEEVATITAGETLQPAVTVLDQRGDAMEIPDWALPSWSVSAPDVLEPLAAGVRAESPGAATATASVAGLERAITVRVNPTALRLVIAHVAVSQTGHSDPELDPDTDARLDVYLTGDEVNFFRPKVRVTVIPRSGAPRAFEMQRTEESVPLAFDPSAPDPAKAWSMTIPGELIQPGVALVVEADPERTIPRAGGSVDRYPATASFALRVKAFTLEVNVTGAYLTQAVQTFAGSIPLVAGRDALLRVFLAAGETNDEEAAVQARLYAGSTLVREITLRRAGAIPTHPDESTLASSWNATIPGAWLVPGLSLAVEVDPEGAFGLKPTSRPRYPATGALALDIRAVPTLWLRMVPILQSGTGQTGTINASNLGQYLAAATAKFPTATVDADVHAPYTTTTVASTAAGWEQILWEIYSLRLVEGSGRYYYGVLRRPAGVSYAGLGYVGYPAAIGWDAMPYAPETFAHELGHNFSLLHAPCGGPAGSDPTFPYANGSTGVLGYDLRTGTLKHPASQKDLMTYCSPEWISDFHYLKTLNFRQWNDWTKGAQATSTAAKEDALLVWGGVAGGRLVLEPAFNLEMRPELPDGSGAYLVQGFDEAGAELFAYRFDPAPVDHVEGAAAFAFAIPSRIARPARLFRLRVSGPEGVVTRSRPATGAAAAAPAGVDAERAGGRVALSWETAHPMALVRDRATGQVLSLARGGGVTLPDRAVEVILSDGVRSVPAQEIR